MKFKTIAEAFNYYRNHSAADIEKRAAAINELIEKDPNADIDALNIELEGLKQAKENLEQRAQKFKHTEGAPLSGGMQPRQQVLTPENVFDSKEYRSAFFKNLMGRSLNAQEKEAFTMAQGVVEKRAGTFISATDAAAVLPTTTLNEIIKKARTMGGLLPEVRSFSVPSKIAIPVATPTNKAAWHVEGAEVAADKAALSSVIFDPNELIKVFSLSAKASTMSIAAFEAYLVDELSACVMDALDDSLINGTGAGQGKGLEKGITWNADNTVSTSALSYADIVSLIAKLKRGYSNGAKFAMNNATLYTKIYGLVDGNKRPIFIADAQNQTVGRILSFPVIVDDNIPDDVIYFGNFKAYLGYNLPEGIMIESSRASSFKQGLIDYRALAIADTQPLVTEAFVKLTKTAG